MSSSKVLGFIAAAIMVLSLTSLSFSQEGKVVEINTRREPVLKVDDFKALIKHEVKGMKAGQTLKLIIDTPNEPDALNAIKQEGHTIAETSKNKDKDSTTYLLIVRK